MIQLSIFKQAVVIFFIILVHNKSDAQMHLTSQLSGSYWEHTELIGGNFGMGLRYDLKRIKIGLNYSFGYGSYNRLDDFHNLEFTYWSTVNPVGGGVFWHLEGIETINPLGPRSDYAKQHHMNIIVEWPIWSHNNNELALGVGGFMSHVEHFYTFTNIILADIDLVPVYRGPINYIPVSHQRFLTYGLDVQLIWNIKGEKRTWSPFVEVGLGPRKGSFITIGTRVSTPLEK